ncbi:MAG: hypothetical protein K7J15_03880 [Candidatus Regiella insecticola]|nr:hypothetical protein [Candidatus Regiella insecticola]
MTNYYYYYYYYYIFLKSFKNMKFFFNKKLNQHFIIVKEISREFYVEC